MSESAPATRTVAQSHRFRWRGAIGVLVLAPAFAVALFSAPIVRAGSWVDVLMNVAGWAAFAAGAAVRFWATLFVGGRKDKVLMTEGPYSMCRNPLYLGSLLLAVAAGLFLKSLIFGAALLVVVLAYVLATVPAEEEFLRARYGEAFDRYTASVPAVVPSFRVFRTPPEIAVNIHTLRLECSRASRWIWLPPLALGVFYLRHQPWWPTFFNLP